MDKLSEEDIDNCMQAFKDLDEDGTDYIKVQDLKLALGRVYIELSD
jgi:Ca2+-binding EF-hand superfamily protein